MSIPIDYVCTARSLVKFYKIEHGSYYHSLILLKRIVDVYNINKIDVEGYITMCVLLCACIRSCTSNIIDNGYYYCKKKIY